MGKLSELMNAGSATVRGLGRGATFGLQKYPAAGIMLLLDQMVGNGSMTPQEAMQVLNDQEQYDKAQYPAAAYGGEIAGSFVPGVGLARGIKTLGDAVKIGAGTGAITSYNERQSPTDAAVGGTFGAALPVAGHAIMQTGLPQRAMTNLSQLMQRPTQVTQAPIQEALPPAYMRWKDAGLQGQQRPMHMADEGVPEGWSPEDWAKAEKGWLGLKYNEKGVQDALDRGFVDSMQQSTGMGGPAFNPAWTKERDVWLDQIAKDNGYKSYAEYQALRTKTADELAGAEIEALRSKVGKKSAEDNKIQSIKIKMYGQPKEEILKAIRAEFPDL